MDKYIFLIFSWAIYFTVHSLLAGDYMKTRGILHLRKSTNYRQFYNVFSLLGLVFILLLNATISSPYLINTGTWTRYISLVVATGGIFILKAAFKQYSMKGFLGLQDDEHENFKASGILKHVRHPIYSGTILIVIGFWLFVPNVSTLVSACCIFIYLAIGIPLEERKLKKKYGDAYRKYKMRVPALVPKFFIRKSEK